jgi:hypothetical protein
VHLGLVLRSGRVSLIFAPKDDILDALFDVFNELFEVIFALEGLYKVIINDLNRSFSCLFDLGDNSLGRLPDSA